MKHTLVRTGLVSIAVAGLCLASQSASLAKVKPATHPTIQASNPSTPSVEGTGFTANGTVKLAEWVDGNKAGTIHRWKITAGSDGSIFTYAYCEGSAADTIDYRAKDLTTGKWSNRSTTVGGCID